MHLSSKAMPNQAFFCTNLAKIISYKRNILQIVVDKTLSQAIGCSWSVLSEHTERRHLSG